MDTRKLEKSKKKKSVLEDQDQDSSIGSSDMSGSSNSGNFYYLLAQWGSGDEN